MTSPAVAVEVSGGSRAGVFADAASALITAGYPRPALEQDAATLRWHMAARVGGLEAKAAVALDGDTPIGFAAATPRMLSLAGDSAPAFVVSFVVVSPTWRKQGLAQRLYDALLHVLAPIGAPILTYAIDDSPGMHALVSAYDRHGFAPRAFSPVQPWGAIRGRSPANVPLVAPPGIAGRLDIDRDAMREHLLAAPHGIALSNGASVTRACRLTDQGRDPYLLLDLLPDHADSIAIATAVAEAMTACPEHGRQLVVPNVDGALEPAVQGAGLRRMPGASYRSWLWVRDTTHPLFQAVQNAHPII